MENQSEKTVTAGVEKLAYTADEACAALGVGRTTLWRFEQRGLIRAVPHLRHKMYSVEMLRRFVNGGKAASA